MMSSEPQGGNLTVADDGERSTTEISDVPSCLDDDIQENAKVTPASAHEVGEQSEICKSLDERAEADTAPLESQPRLDKPIEQSLKPEIPGHQSKMNGSSVSSENAANYMSATATILGNTSDRDDFLPNRQPYDKKHNHDIDSDINETENGGGIIDGVKKWFSPSVESDNTEPVEHDYHRDAVDNIQSAIKSSKAKVTESDLKLNQVKSLDENNYDESLLEKDDGDLEMGRQRSSTYDETEVRRNMGPNGDCNEGGDGKSKFKYSNGSWGSKSRSKTDDELRVMGECSFFYDGMDNEENPSPSHKISGQPHKFHRARVVNPRLVAQAISSSARRQWTERRYRRRLKQSTFEPPASMWNNRRQSQQRIDSQTEKQQELPTYELTTEHRQAFLAAHAALNDKLANEYSRNRHAINIAEYGYDLDIDLDLNLAIDDSQQEEIRADLTKSSLAIRGSGQIRLPIDNVRLVMDSHLQPGILSVESRAGDGACMGYENYGNGNRYGNINANEVVPLTAVDESGETKKNQKAHRRMSSEADQPWRRNELSYVLTVDDSLYRRLFQEISDSYRLPLGMYYCCHVVESESSHDHVGIGVAISILMVVFVFLIVGMLMWPMD